MALGNGLTLRWRDKGNRRSRKLSCETLSYHEKAKPLVESHTDKILPAQNVPHPIFDCSNNVRFLWRRIGHERKGGGLKGNFSRK